MKRQLLTSDGRTITLNPEQNAALDKMFIWYNSGGIYFLLSGYAGTGKTTITKFFLDEVTRRDAPRVIVSAPTHQAKKIIVKHTGREGMTLQRLLGLAPDVNVEEFNPEKPEFIPKRPSTLHEYDLVILDEVSMVNKELFKYITQHIGKRTKLLMLGDPAQLPPVKEKISPVFISDLIRAKAELTLVERNAGGILSTATAIRNALNSFADPFEYKNVVDSNGKGIVFIDNKLFAAEILTAFLSEEFTEDPAYAKIMCWTNDRVRWWNNALRKRRVEMIHPGKEVFPIMQGDLLKAYSGYEGKIENSNDYLVTRVEQTEFNCIYPGKKADKEIARLKTYGVYMVNIDSGRQVFVHVLRQDIQANVDKWLKAYWAYIGETHHDKGAWKEFFEFRSWCLLTEQIQTKNPMKPINKDLDYAYAITIHKSQGSEYENVFVDSPDIDNNRIVIERNSLKYVALSRASKMVYYCI